MKQVFIGILAGILLTTGALLFMGALPAEDDSISIYLGQLEKLIRGELAENLTNNRFQLQSFSIDRTHWHYMMDTSTGELYRLEVGRTPDKSKWILVANSLANQQQQDF